MKYIVKIDKNRQVNIYTTTKMTIRVVKVLLYHLVKYIISLLNKVEKGGNL